MNNHIYLLLLEILSCIFDDQHQDKPKISMNQNALPKLIEDAIHHKVFPLVMDVFLQNKTVNSEYYISALRGRLLSLYRNEVIHQAKKTADFLLLYEYFASKELHPLVLKGIICRSLYPQPEHRASADEDLLIDPADFSKYHEAILAYGLKPVDMTEDIWSADEVSYESKESHLYIEVHKTLFDTNAAGYANLNDCFQGALQRRITQDIYGRVFHTLSHTDHLLYLILHAFKHFLYSGFGIRQVCDIIMFSERYREEICWPYIREQLYGVNAFIFTKAIYKIGNKYLMCSNYMPEYLSGWDCEEIDEKPLLEDIMSGGIYGVEDINRAHAANITLQAVSAQRQGRHAKGLWQSVFPGKAYLQRNFLYANAYPFFLPIAWAHRILRYLTHDKKNKTNPIRSISIGNSRIQLLKLYGIIQDKDKKQLV